MTSLTNISSVIKSPLLYTTHEFTEKLVERGFEINLSLRNRLMELTSLRDYKTTESLKIFWNDDDIIKKIEMELKRSEQQIQIRKLLTILCVLSKYKINYINLAVILYSLSIQEIRNLYRYYYLEWVNMKDDFNTPLKQIKWRYTPREFNLLPVDDIYIYWFDFIQQFITDNDTKHALSIFFINRFYTYMTPFV